MKKILSLVLAVIMLCALSISSFAYDSLYRVSLKGYEIYKETGEVPEDEILDVVFLTEAPTPTKILDWQDSWNKSWWYDGYRFCKSENLVNNHYITTFTPEPEPGGFVGESCIKYEVRPFECLTRGMMAVILGRYEGFVFYLSDEECNAFCDVENGKWYSGAMQWAYDNGILEGYEVSGELYGRPNANVTREEFVTMIYRFFKSLKYRGVDLSETAELSDEFADKAEVSDWATEAMQWACNAGIIKGKPIDGETYLSPGDYVTRAETFVIIYRLNEISPCSEFFVSRS